MYLKKRKVFAGKIAGHGRLTPSLFKWARPRKERKGKVILTLITF